MASLTELLTNVVEGTNLAEVIDCQIKSNQATLLCRIKDKDLKAWVGEEGFYHYLLKNEGDNWGVHLCKNFRLRGVKGIPKKMGKFVFCWMISISSVNIILACQEFIEITRRFNNQVVPPKNSSSLKEPAIVQQFARRPPKVKTGPELTSPPIIGNPKDLSPAVGSTKGALEYRTGKLPFEIRRG